MSSAKQLLEQMKKTQEELKNLKQKRLGAIASTPSASSKTLEQKATARFGVKSFNELIKINTEDKRFKAVGADARQAVKDLKEAADVAILCAHIFKKPVTETKAYSELVEPALKAFGIDSGDQGYAWIPTAVSSSYVEEYNLERKVAGLFQEIKMPTNPFTFPVSNNGSIAMRVAENTQLSPQQVIDTSSITFNAVKLSGQMQLPEELNEDSAVDMMKVLRQDLLNGQEKAMEIAILEGDTANTHQHTNTQIPGATGAPAAASPEKIFDGLRKRALAAGTALKVDCGAQPVSEAKLTETRKKLGKFGVDVKELALICGVKGYNDLLALDDVRTLEQYGPQATVLNGELAKYEGMPVIVSEYLREDTDATGVNGATPANNIKTSFIIVNRKRWFTGLRRATEIKIDGTRVQFDVWDMVSYSRRAFQGVLAANGSNAASESSVALLYNAA